MSAQKTLYSASYTKEAPLINGDASDPCWIKGNWDYFQYELFGNDMPSADDFSGRYKVVWDSSQIYILVEVVDDIQNSDNPPHDGWWKDDCVEVFLDEDHSGGRHEVASWISEAEQGACDDCAYNAFAYHTDVATFDAIDLGQDGGPHTYNDNCKAVVSKDGNNYVWEFAIKQFGAEFIFEGENTPKELALGQVLGFCMAYCDNDERSDERENLIGTQQGSADAWINADLFGELILLSCEAEVSVILDESELPVTLEADVLPQTSYQWSVMEGNEQTVVSTELVLEAYDPAKAYQLVVSNAACVDTLDIDASVTGTNPEYVSVVLKVYPNPLRNQLNIKASSAIESYQIYDQSGRLLISEDLKGLKCEDLQRDLNVSGGVCFLQVKTKQGIYSEKIIFVY
ncbi:MAG: sugar-binding protein [Bacteroidota bacterium]